MMVLFFPFITIKPLSSFFVAAAIPSCNDEFPNEGYNKNTS
jgi:hypothetical protein